MSVPLMSQPRNSMSYVDHAMNHLAVDDAHVEITYTADANGRMRASNESESEESCLRRMSRCACFDEKCLDTATAFVILANVVLMGMELDIPWAGYRYIEQVMLCVYILDVGLRMKWNGLRLYCCDKAHLLDVTIVAASVFEQWIMPMTMYLENSMNQGKNTKRGSLIANMTMSLRAFRLVRAIRLIKLVKFAKPLYMILQSMNAAFSRVCWVMVLICVFLYAFALVFTQLLGRDMLDSLPGDDPLLAHIRRRFSTVPRTFFELFRAMCGDVTDFGVLVSADDNFVVPCAYMLFQVTTPWLILAIFTAEVVDTTISCGKNQDLEEITMKALHTRTVQRTKLTNELHELFANVSNSGTGPVETDSRLADAGLLGLDSLASFLEEEPNVEKLNEITGLSPFQAINAWEAIEDEGSAILEDYIDGLILASHQSMEHSVLRMEAQMRGMLRNQTAIMKALGTERARPQSPARPSQVLLERQASASSASSAASKNLSSGFAGIWTEMTEMRTEIRTGLVQLQSSMQAVQADQTGLRRGMSATKDAEHKAVTEVRKMQRELSESSSQIHGALLGIGDVRNDISSFFKQATANRSPQIDELCGEVHQLRSEVSELARAEDLSQLVQVSCSPQIDRLSGEVHQLRSEVLELARADELGQLLQASASPSPQMDELLSEVHRLHTEVSELARSEDSVTGMTLLGQSLQASSSQPPQLDELRGDVQGLRSDVANFLECEQASGSRLEEVQLLQIEEIRSEMHQLRNELSTLARAEELGQLMQVMASESRRIEPTDLSEMRVGFTDLQGGVEALRAEMALLAASLRSDLASCAGSATPSSARPDALDDAQSGRLSASRRSRPAETMSPEPREEHSLPASSSSLDAAGQSAQSCPLRTAEPRGSSGRGHSDSPLLQRLRRERRSYAQGSSDSALLQRLQGKIER